MSHRTIRPICSVLLLLLVGICGLGNVLPAAAQSPSFGIRPQDSSKGYFEFTVAPGEKVQDVLVAYNPTDTPLTLNIQPVRGMTMAAGNITFADDAGGAAQWIAFPSAGVINVPAQGSVNLPFELAVPQDAAPGEYVAGFAALLAEDPAAVTLASTGSTAAAADDSKSSFQVRVRSKVSVAVVITVPGASECQAAVASIAAGPVSDRWQLVVGMQNTGNVHFKAEGNVTARPTNGGDPVAQSTFKVGYFIPGDAIEYPLALDPYPAAGDYKLEVNLLTDCGFKTAYTQPIKVSEEDVRLAVAEAQAEAQSTGQSSAATDEAARLLAQAELIRSISLLVAVVAALVIAAVVVGIVLLRRRKSA